MYTVHAEAAGNKGFTVLAWTHDNGRLAGIEADAMVGTVEEAEAIAAKFPKALRVRGSTIHDYNDVRNPVTKGWVSFRASLNSNGVTGDKNETSIARIRKFFAVCDKLGLTLKFDDIHALNQMTDRAEVEKELVQ